MKFRNYPVLIGLSLSTIFSLAAFGQNSGTRVQYNGSGLSSFSYNGLELLSSGTPSVSDVLLQGADGSTTAGSSVVRFTAVDASSLTTTQLYSWGQLQCRYVFGASQIRLFVAVSNTSPSTIQQIHVQPLSLKFPVQPSEYDGVTPILFHNIGGPTVLPLTFGSSMLTLANEDVTQPLLVGFPGTSNPPNNTTFPVILHTGTSTYSDRLPFINRPVPPGGTLQFQLSFRFGAAGSPLTSLAGDVYLQFAANYPMRYGWTDRRAIGTLFLASSGTAYPTNPRGWFNDPTVDTTTPDGIKAFQTRVLAYADTSVGILQNMNAQGAIVWDMEGEQYPNPVTYIGDPRLVPTLAPEIDGIADAFFQKFRNAGLQVGMTIRPQEFHPATASASATQADSTDPASVLNAKIAYAKQRWGISLFYIDSNGDPNYPLDSNVVLAVQQTNPDVLIIPEHGNFSYYAFSAPYGELRQGVVSTFAPIRAVYPGAFGVINTADGPISDRKDQLVQAVSQGDILLFRAWYPDPANDLVRAIYLAATGQ